MTRIGIIRCEQMANICSGFLDFESIRRKVGKFEDYENVELLGYDTCRGCPGDKVKDIARSMRDYSDVEVIHVSTCMKRNLPENFGFMNESELYNTLLNLLPKRPNQERYVRNVARIIKSKDLTLKCPFLNKIVEEIKSLGIKVEMGTHLL